MTTPKSYVRVMLEHAGIQPTEPEVVALEAAVEGMQARLEELWQVDIGETAPVSTFHAATASNAR